MIQYRNFRYRHPIPEELINDYFIDVYYHLVDLLGISNNLVEKDGIIIERIKNCRTLGDLGISATYSPDVSHIIDVIKEH